MGFPLWRRPPYACDQANMRTTLGALCTYDVRLLASLLLLKGDSCAPRHILCVRRAKALAQPSSYLPGTLKLLRPAVAFSLRSFSSCADTMADLVASTRAALASGYGMSRLCILDWHIVNQLFSYLCATQITTAATVGNCVCQSSRNYPLFGSYLCMLTPLQDDGSCSDSRANENILLHHAGRSLKCPKSCVGLAVLTESSAA
jgi:hypothetical protein